MNFCDISIALVHLIALLAFHQEIYCLSEVNSSQGLEFLHWHMLKGTGLVVSLSITEFLT